ncbi:MAG TPA: hypothetical protein VIN58_08855 [Roseateles sp.]
MATTPQQPGPRKPPSPRRRRATTSPAPPQPVVERLDGYRWVGDADLPEFGALDNHGLAREERDGGSVEGLAPDALSDAERELDFPALPEAGRDDDDSPHLQEE